METLDEQSNRANANKEMKLQQKKNIEQQVRTNFEQQTFSFKFIEIII